MDTQLAVDTIKGLKNTIDSNLSGLTAQSDALGVALNIIQGTLDFQAKSLDAKYKGTIDQLTQENSDLNGQVTDLSTQVTDLSSTVNELETNVAVLNPTPIERLPPEQIQP